MPNKNLSLIKQKISQFDLERQQQQSLLQAKTMKANGLVDEFFGTATTIGGYKKDPHEE